MHGAGVPGALFLVQLAEEYDGQRTATLYLSLPILFVFLFFPQSELSKGHSSAAPREPPCRPLDYIVCYHQVIVFAFSEEYCHQGVVAPSSVNC